jgi:hypothetical protein
MIWVWITLVILWCLVLTAPGCGLPTTKPEPTRCYKAWDKSAQRIVYECEKVSESTRDGER